MKKIALFFATIAAVVGLSACNEDESPILLKPTEFKLNTPPFAEQLYQLTEDGSIILTCSQPNYGVGVKTTYSVEMSLTEDFEDSRTVTLADPLSATLTFSTAAVNLAALDMLGVVDEETWEPYANDRVMPLYFRATAQAAEVAYSVITSNTVTLANVEIFYAIKTPGFIYLVGSPEGWKGPDAANADHYKDWRLFENEAAIGSQVYSAVFNMPAAPMFRFYTELNGWDNNSLGSQADDNPIDFELTDGVCETSLVAGKGSFNFPDFEGGEMTVTVDLNTMTVRFEAGAVEVHPTTYVYVVGSNAGWKDPTPENQALYDGWRLSCTDGSGVYTGTFTMPATPMFRFYTELGSWDTHSLGWQVEDGPGDFALTNGVLESSLVAGKGSFNFPDFAGGEMTITLDLNAMKVKFEAGGL